MIKSFRIALSMSVFTAFSAWAQSDPAVVLAQILAEKGTISAAEFSRVQTSDEHGRLTLLTEILRDKGVLNSTDLARFSAPTVEGQPTAVANAALAPSSEATAGKSISQVSDAAVSIKKRLPVSLFGTLLFTTGYNTAVFNYTDIPMIASKQGSDPTGGDKNFFASARQTRLGLNLDPTAALGGKLSGTFEFDLVGGGAPFVNGIDMNLFRMRRGFGKVEWNNLALEAGQDWSVFAPLNPTSLNEFGIPELTAAGNPWIRSPQLRLEMKTKSASGNSLLWQLAALNPDVGDYLTTAISAARVPGIGERGRMPSLESRLAWTKSRGDRDYTVGLSAHYGRGKNAGTITAAGSTVNVQSGVDSWGIALDYVLPFGKLFNLSGEAYEGRALGIYGSASGESVGAVRTAGAHGVESRGGWIQGQLNFSKQWQMNLAYGLDAPNASQLPVGNRSRNQQYMANIIDKLSRNINASIEYRRILSDYRNQLFANERGDHMDLGIAYVF